MFYIRLITTKFIAIFDRIVDVLAVLAACILVYLIVSVSADVAIRGLKNSSIPNTLEISEYLLLFLTFLIVPWVLKRNEHVKIELLVDRLRLGAQSVLKIITCIVDALLCLLLTWIGAAVTWDLFQARARVEGVLEPLMAPIIAIIPLGFLLLSIQFLRMSYDYWRKWREARQTDKKVIDKSVNI